MAIQCAWTAATTRTDETMMNIHVCRRCEGCGHVTGGFKWEVPWTRWAPTADAEKESFLEPHACPDCGGTGALIEMGGGVSSAPAFAFRRSLRAITYADHVAAVLRSQATRPATN